MTADLEHNAAPTMSDYLRVLRQRKGIIFITVLVVVLVAVGLSLREEPRYAAKSEVLVGLGADHSRFPRRLERQGQRPA